MKPCEYVTKESTPRNPGFERCDAPTVADGRFCAKHEQIVRENPAEDVRQRTFRPTAK